MEKYVEYALKINEALATLFDSESDNHINIDELRDEDNFKQFMYALSTLVPLSLYNKVTTAQVDCLGFNHVANRLTFEYVKLTLDKETTENTEEEEDDSDWFNLDEDE